MYNHEAVLKEKLSNLMATKSQYPFPKLLRRIREIFKYTRAEVGELTGMNPVQVYYLEQGVLFRVTKMAAEERVKILADFYGVPADELLAKLDEYKKSRKSFKTYQEFLDSQHHEKELCA